MIKTFSPTIHIERKDKPDVFSNFSGNEKTRTLYAELKTAFGKYCLGGKILLVARQRAPVPIYIAALEAEHAPKSAIADATARRSVAYLSILSARAVKCPKTLQKPSSLSNKKPPPSTPLLFYPYAGIR